MKQLLVALAVSLPLASCYGPLQLSRNDASDVLSQQLMDAPNPSLAGAFEVKRLFYGSGNDRRRIEYRDSVAIRTGAVDLSKFVSLEPKITKYRNRYWGFDLKHAPVNARVWYPSGKGPFPLVLIAHGNHNMKDYSDPGYAYLGDLLASRGYIVASIDMNFLNGVGFVAPYADGRMRNENDGRAVLMLEHAKAWAAFNRDARNPFYNRVDLSRIALIGHSRGGESVGHAAAFNRLSRYPDDANVKLDYGLGIKGIVAIAPVDAQYRPADRFEPVHNVDYLTLQGSHDGDVTSFAGLRQYQRVRFTDGRDHFKAAVYIYRANHGQFNTVWGRRDRGGKRADRFLDMRGLMPGEVQRDIAKLYIAAFLEASLKGDKRYLPLLVDHRRAGGWLPRTMYITRFQDDSYRTLADFEEDVDVTTSSFPNVRLRAERMAEWKEAPLLFRGVTMTTGERARQENQVVWLGWNQSAPKDTTRSLPATFSVLLTDSVRRAWQLGTASAFVFDLAARQGAPKAPKDSSAIQLTLEAEDVSGNTARVLINRYAPIRRPLYIRTTRAKGQDARLNLLPHDIVLQTFVIPLRDFATANRSFNAATVKELRFVFAPSMSGSIVLDDLGFSKLDPAYRTAQW